MLLNLVVKYTELENAGRDARAPCERSRPDEIVLKLDDTRGQVAGSKSIFHECRKDQCLSQ